MDIKCNQSPFEQMVDVLLRELSRVGFFGHGLLIGSWPMVVFAQVHGLVYGLRTGDIDFALVNTAHKSNGVPLPNLLKQLGYELLTDYQSGIEKYVQDTFEVEFITHRRGGTSPPSVEVPAWQVAAQPLPFIDILFIRPLKVNVGDYSIRIPSPEALMVHKLIIAQRRRGLDKEEKKEKDLQQCLALSDITNADEVQMILREKHMSTATIKDIMSSCETAKLDITGLGFHWL